MIRKLREETLIRLISPHLSTHFRPVKAHSFSTSPRHRAKFAKLTKRALVIRTNRF